MQSAHALTYQHTYAIVCSKKETAAAGREGGRKGGGREGKAVGARKD